MTFVANIDFETRSATDIKLGLPRYFADAQADILMLAIQLPGMEQPEVWHRGHDLKQPAVNEDVLQGLFEHLRTGGLVDGWNVAFEYHCWNKLGRKLGWPELQWAQCQDTMARAAAQNLPQSLGRCAQVLGLPQDQQKDTRGKYLIQRLSKPHKPSKARPGVWVEDPELFAEFVTYCQRDVIVERAVARKLRPLSDFQRRIWMLTQRINDNGVPVALDECAAISDIVEAEKDRLNKQLKEITQGAVPAASKRQQLLDWCNKRIADEGGLDQVDFDEPSDDEEDRPGHEEAMANMKGKTVEAVLAREWLPADVRRALEIRAAVVQTSTAKFAKMMRIAAPDGTLKGMHVWHGASTGRWASRGGLNTQNFARPVLSDSDIATAFDNLDHGSLQLLFGDKTMDAMVSCLRGVLKAPPGHRFIDADYSSVENRVGVWLAGQWDKVEMFAKGFDEYKVFSSKSLHRVPYEAVTKDMRQVSKAAVLGSLFGQGPNGLVEYAKTYGVTLTPERSKEVVKLYRQEYNKVVKLWYACGDASVDAVQNPGTWFDAGDKLSLICHKKFLWMRLPSGRLVAWASPIVEMKLVPWTETVVVGRKEDGTPLKEERPVYREVVTVESIETKTRQWCRHPLIGSSIFQTGVQGTAADILAEGAEFVDAAGYPVVLLAHDEILSCVENGFGDPDEFGRLMCQVTDWRRDLPLAYEAWAGDRYRK